MARTKPALPDNTKLDYTTVEGVPTIDVAARLTTRAQVQALIERLDKLAMVLPEARVRKVRAKPKPAAARRPTNNQRIDERTGE